MDRFRATNDEIKPMPGIAVSATGEGRTFSATTNDLGEFVLTGLRLGAYDLTTKVPQGYESPPGKIAIHDPRGCGEVGLTVWYDGSLIGLPGRLPCRCTFFPLIVRQLMHFLAAVFHDEYLAVRLRSRRVE
jgi:hypothetical protein